MELTDMVMPAAGKPRTTDLNKVAHEVFEEEDSFLGFYWLYAEAGPCWAALFSWPRMRWRSRRPESPAPPPVLFQGEAPWASG